MRHISASTRLSWRRSALARSRSFDFLRRARVHGFALPQQTLRAKIQTELSNLEAGQMSVEIATHFQEGAFAVE
jgi:hypothetical protein